MKIKPRPAKPCERWNKAAKPATAIAASLTEWDMEGEWSRVTLGDVITLQRGFDLPAQDRKPGKVPIVSSSGISDYHSDVAAKGPGVVTGRYGTIGQVFLIKGDYWPLNTTLWVKDFHGNDPQFISYLLRTVDFDSCSDKSSVPGVNRNDLHQIPVLLPPLPEQKAIAHILGTLDDKIELNRQMNETLEAMARALFKSWFMDFDPVRAKAEGRDTGLPKHIADLFPGSFEDSELGEIPRGWGVRPIGAITDIVGGTTPSTKDLSYWEGGMHAWATPKDLSALSAPVLLDTERRITDAGLSQVGSGLLPKGTVLLSSRAPIGYLAITEIPVAINQGFIAMTPKAGTSNLFLLLWASIAGEEIVSRANGSTFLEISKSNFRPIPVITPSVDVMRGFEKLARPLYEHIVECVRESRTLTILRDALLRKLISGEMRAKEAAKCDEMTA